MLADVGRCGQKIVVASYRQAVGNGAEQQISCSDRREEGVKSGAPNGIRIRAAGLKGRCPRPLDDGGTRCRRGIIPCARGCAGTQGARRGRPPSGLPLPPHPDFTSQTFPFGRLLQFALPLGLLRQCREQSVHSCLTKICGWSAATRRTSVGNGTRRRADAGGPHRDRTCDLGIGPPLACWGRRLKTRLAAESRTIAVSGPTHGAKDNRH